MRAAVAALAALAAAHAVPAHAAPPTLAAIAVDDSDARRSLVLGPSGQVYESAQDGWTRRAEGGVAATVAAAARAGAHDLIAGGDGAVFRYEPATGWTALHLGRGAAVVARGARPVVAVARELFDVAGAPVKLATAPEAVTAIGSSRAGVVVMTAKGVYRLTGTKLRRLTGAPTGATVVGDRWAITSREALSLATGVRASSELTIAAATQAPDGALLAIATTGTDLITVRDNGLVTERLALSAPGTPVAIAVDAAGRILIAYAEGRIALGSRTDPTWTIFIVHDQLPAAHPGPPPALSAR